MNQSVSFFIPAYNEEDDIEDVVLEAFEVGQTMGIDFEVIVVNDGSSDNTKEILENLKISHNDLILIHHETNLGIAQAMINGYKTASKPWIFFNSSDKQAPMSHLLKMWPHRINFDFIVAKYGNRKDSILRIFCSRCYHLLIRLFLGIKFHNINAMKLFKKEIFSRISSLENGLIIDAELAARANQMGYKLTEIELEHFPRMSGKTKVLGIKKTLSTFLKLIKVSIKVNAPFLKTSIRSRKKVK